MLTFLGAFPPTTFLPARVRQRRGARSPRRAQGAARGADEHDGPADGAPRSARWDVGAARRAARRAGHALTDDDGIVMSVDRMHAFVFVETRSSPFDSDAQRRFRSTLAEWMTRSAPASARMQTAGTAQYAIASEAQIKGDVNRIGIISTIGSW